LVRRHYKSVFLVCFGILGNVHDAEDVAQDAMLKGFQQVRQLREGAQFGGWIVAIARNLSINLLRQRKTVRRTLAAGRPAERERTESSHEDLQQAVARLPGDLRLPLVMYYFDGQDVKAVAGKLAISTSGVYQKLRTAIKELHDVLTAQGDAP
jgi:RNA polymerase sigma-70 factor (ECF subfamily)